MNDGLVTQVRHSFQVILTISIKFTHNSSKSVWEWIRCLKNKLFKGFFILFAPVFLFFVVFLRLDKGEQPEEADVIIVPEGATIRAYQAVGLLLDGYSRSNQLIVSSATEHNVPNYLEAGG